jgi:transposase
VLNGIFWILCSGAKWRDLPERYGPWKTVYDRFRQWRDDGTFEAILARLQLRLREDGLMDLDTWMIDSTSICATRAASGGGKKGVPRTHRPCPGPQSGRADDQDPHGL